MVKTLLDLISEILNELNIKSTHGEKISFKVIKKVGILKPTLKFNDLNEISLEELYIGIGDVNNLQDTIQIDIKNEDECALYNVTQLLKLISIEDIHLIARVLATLDDYGRCNIFTGSDTSLITDLVEYKSSELLEIANKIYCSYKIAI